MAVRTTHQQQPHSIYFVTFTCYQWLPLFEATCSYDLIYKWFDHLYTKNIRVAGYVIMPNHMHVMLYFPVMTTTLNAVISNAKRFMAYEIVKRLATGGNHDLLHKLAASVSRREQKKGQLHKVFNESFDAKECISPAFIYQKLDYMHHNPTNGKWMLADSFLNYKYSSAAFYENGSAEYDKLIRIEEVM